MSHRTTLGRRGEDIAVEFLCERGYQIVARNWRCREGELDVIARDEDTLVVVEVRTRRGTRFGSPEESITPAKQEHLIAAAQSYLQEAGFEEADWRIDVIAIEIGPAGQIKRLNHIQSAV